MDSDPMALSHFSQGDRQGRAAERLDQPRVFGVEAAHLVDDARAVFFGVAGDLLDLLWRQLRCLFRRDGCRGTSTLGQLPEDAA